MADLPTITIGDAGSLIEVSSTRLFSNATTYQELKGDDERHTNAVQQVDATISALLLLKTLDESGGTNVWAECDTIRGKSHMSGILPYLTLDRTTGVLEVNREYLLDETNHTPPIVDNGETGSLALSIDGLKWLKNKLDTDATYLQHAHDWTAMDFEELAGVFAISMALAQEVTDDETGGRGIPEDPDTVIPDALKEVVDWEGSIYSRYPASEPDLIKERKSAIQSVLPTVLEDFARLLSELNGQPPSVERSDHTPSLDAALEETAKSIGLTRQAMKVRALTRAAKRSKISRASSRYSGVKKTKGGRSKLVQVHNVDTGEDEEMTDL